MSKKLRVAGSRLAWPNHQRAAGREPVHRQRQVLAPGRLQDEIERALRGADVVDDGRGAERG
jgi:hypothetical protein